jgi:hypothetical protein
MSPRQCSKSSEENKHALRQLVAFQCERRAAQRTAADLAVIAAESRLVFVQTFQSQTATRWDTICLVSRLLSQ